MRKFNLKLENGTHLTVKPPTLKSYYKGLISAKTDDEIFSAVAEICNRNYENTEINLEFVLNNFTVDDFSNFVKDFSEWVQNEKQSDPN